MLLIDVSGIVFPVISWQMTKNKNTELTIDLVRHVLLNCIRMHVHKNKQYGKVVLCLDNQNYWRKKFFPFYKHGRKKNREKSTIDWNLFFKFFNELKEEIKNNLPYTVLDIDGAEADDIIGTLVPMYAAHEKILIISGDEDFLQLQHYKNVEQYAPVSKKFIKSEHPARDLKIKIICGDPGDGVPNIISPYNCFVLGIRQSKMTEQKLNKYLNEDWSKLSDSDEIKVAFKRNETLIDLKHTPIEIKQNIINSFNEAKPSPKGELLNYFMKYKLKNLLSVIDEF